MRGDVDLAKLPRPKRLVLLEDVVQVNTKGVRRTLSADLRLGVSLAQGVSRETSTMALCSSTFRRPIWTDRSRTRWTALKLQHNRTAWMHRGPTVTP